MDWIGLHYIQGRDRIFVDLWSRRGCVGVVRWWSSGFSAGLDVDCCLEHQGRLRTASDAVDRWRSATLLDVEVRRMRQVVGGRYHGDEAASQPSAAGASNKLTKIIIMLNTSN